MRSVGLRELKNRLSEYVREVRSGKRVLVTDRGEVVAQLIPAGTGNGERRVRARLADLARRGEVTLGSRNSAKAYPELAPLLKVRKGSELLDAERGTQ